MRSRVSVTGGRLYRGQDAAVAGTATEVAGDRLTNLECGWRGRVAEQVGDGDDQTGRAKAALHCSFVDEGLLDGVQPFLLVGLKSFERGDLTSDCGRRKDKARTHQGAIDENGARSGPI